MTQEEWMEEAERLLDDYVGAAMETAVFNVTQQSGMTVRMARPRKKALLAHLQQRPLPVRTKFPERYEELRRHCLRLAHLHEDDQSSCSQALRMLGYHGLSLAAVSLLDDLVEGAQLAAPVPDNNYVQPVPDHCDRIVWRNFYYSLPLALPSPSLPVREEPTAWMHEFTDPHSGERSQQPRKSKPADYELMPGDVVFPLFAASPSVQNMGKGETGKDGVNPSVNRCGYCGSDMIPGSECTTSARAGQCDMYQQYAATRKVEDGVAIPQTNQEKP